MATVTAKVICTGNDANNAGGPDTNQLSFAPDYADGRNAEWAAATPSLSLTMTVKAAVAEHFRQGQRLTLAFVPEDDEPTAE